ncbi:hypothetical protein [Ureibacillus sp. GCM10028918]|uniref:hypothetical protein n=1 Tax=Ureibacillus sp. GCM10028918 TaxID=3273429 RepID=UPI003611A23C
MYLLILAVALITLGLVMYAVGKLTKRRWLKHLAMLPVIAGIVLLLILVYYLSFVGAIPAYF